MARGDEEEVWHVEMIATRLLPVFKLGAPHANAIAQRVICTGRRAVGRKLDPPHTGADARDGLAHRQCACAFAVFVVFVVVAAAVAIAVISAGWFLAAEPNCCLDCEGCAQRLHKYKRHQKQPYTRAC